MPQENMLDVLSDPLAQELLNSKLPLQLAYIGLDGAPRGIPIWFHWNGRQFVLGTPSNAPKVKILTKNPKVALTIDKDSVPPEMLLVRGTAKVEMVDGVVPEYLQAANKYLGDEAGLEFEKDARGKYKQMARIIIEPAWAKLIDFRTRLPSALEALAKESHD